MDQDEELAKLKWLLGVGLIFLISAFYSYGELKFAVWGRTAEATIQEVKETSSMGRRGRRGRRKPELAVHYTFTEADGTNRSERDDVPIDFPLLDTGNVTVEYLPGVANSSRLQGHSRKGAVYIFFACLAAMAFLLFRIIREANAPPPSRGRTPRRSI